MVKSLVESLGRQSTNTALDSIDRWLDDRSGPSFFQGPFGVMNFEGDRLNNPEYIYNRPQLELSVPNQSPYHEVVDESLTKYTNTVAEETNTSVNERHADLTPSSLETFHDESHHDSPHRHIQRPLFTHSLSQYSPLISTTIPPRAPELLRHFKDHVIFILFSFKRKF